MSQWANQHPEEMAEIAALPLNQQNAALRAAIGYDPDRIRDEHSAHTLGDRPPTSGSASKPGTLPGVGPFPSGSPASGSNPCEACGAPADAKCSPTCETNR